MTEPRQRYPLVFGLGLDRNTGKMSVEPGSFEDVRNAWAEEQKLLLRGGLADTTEGDFFEDVTDIVGIFPFRSINGGVVVGYDRNTRLMTVWRTDGLGGNPILVGEWETLIAGAALPRVTGAESYGKFFLAHDEPLINVRAATIYFDPQLDPGMQIVPLLADFDGDDIPEGVYFRIVYAYLNYLLGTGFGTEDEPNRPEILRVSLPADPTTFNKQHYAIFGIRDDAITALGSAGGVLHVQKRTQGFILTGTERASFGVKLVDANFGAINHQLGLTVGGTYYFWSEQGPRLAEGSKSTDLAMPLELEAPTPDSLIDAGPIDYGFSVYHPERRGILFHFPQLDPIAERTLVYALGIRNAQLFKWHYWELGQAVFSAAVLVEGQSTVGARTTAFADEVTAVDDGVSGTGRKVLVEWDNNSLGEDETVQIYRKPDGGDWELAHSLAPVGVTQSVSVPGFLALTDYEIAIRFIKSGIATEGYESSDPDDWDAPTAADSKALVTTLCSAPVITVSTWSRTSSTETEVHFVWTLAELGVAFSLERSDDGIAGWAEVEAIPAAGNPRTFDYLVPGADLYTGKFFRLIAVKGAEESAPSNEAEVFFGVQDIPDILLVAQDSATSEFQMFIQFPPAGISKIEVQTSADGSTGWTTQYLGSPAAYPIEVPSPIALASPTHYRARFLKTAFGVDDPGDFTAVDDVTLTNAAAPGAPTIDSTSCDNYDNGGGARTATMTINMTGVDDYLFFYEYALFTGGVYVKQRKIYRLDPLPADDTVTLADVYITGVWDPFTFPGSPLSGYLASFEVRLYVITSVTKISAPDSADQRARITGGPTNVAIVQPNPLVGQIDVTWDNNNPTSLPWTPSANDKVFVRWNMNPIDAVPSRALDSPVDDSEEEMSGPDAGLPALPATGEEIKVLVVWGTRQSGAEGDPSVTKYSDIEVENGVLHEMGT